MKIVVVGLGKVGRALTQQLSADKHDIVVIDRNPTVVDDICNICDVRGVTGNGGCYDVQKEAFEDGADLLIATTSSDEINILACLVAKKLGTQHTIARIRNPEYEKQLRFMRQELGLSMVINPEKATAREIARVLRFPNALKLEQFSKQRFELVEYRLTEGNPLTGLQLSDLYSNMRVKMLICAVARGKQITIPTGSFTLEEGDTIYLMATPQELEQFFRGCGWEPRFVEGDEPETMHQQMAAAVDWAIREIKRIQRTARESGKASRPRWPMLVLRTPKGWTGPKEVDGNAIEGSWRAHQVPISMGADESKHLPLLEQWLRSYKPEELFNEDGTPVELIASFPPKGEHRMGANPHANGGLLLRDLRTPDFRDYAVDIPAPGEVEAQDMYVLGTYVRDVMKLNMESRNFRIFAPDETASNRLQAVFDVTGRRFLDEQVEGIDEHLDPDGRVMDSMLSEHFCEGFLEGYLLTGRHGFFDSYEAFIRIVDSMFSQHAKWLKMCNELPWRHDIASLNYILASNVWQQDHNGFTHQDPGFLDHVANKKADVVRMYLPPDANCLLSCFDHCIKSRNYVNVIVASKHPRQQWLTMEQAVKHCTQGIGIWEWASNDQGQEPDVVMACCGDTPTLETLAAVTILRRELPELKIRVVNVVDLMKLQPHTEHPHGLTDAEYDTLFTKDKPIIFAYHGYPTLIHELTYRRHNRNLHVRGYKEEGTITTPFDMRVLNDIDRFDLVIDTVQRLPQLGNRGAYLIQKMNDKLVEHRQYIKDNGVDLPEVRAWKWNDGKGVEV